jgi:hypothetical protein
MGLGAEGRSEAPPVSATPGGTGRHLFPGGKVSAPGRLSRPVWAVRARSRIKAPGETGYEAESRLTLLFSLDINRDKRR